MSSKVFINCPNFKLRDELRAQICAIVEKLFGLELFVANVRLTLESNYDRKSKIIYKASLLLELRKSEIIVCGEAELPLLAVKSIVDQAERQLLERLYLRQAERPSVTPQPTTLNNPAVAH